MVLPLLEAIEFTKGLREALPFFESLVALDPLRSATSILEEARQAGLKFRDSPAFQLVGQLKKNLEAVRSLGVVDLDEIPGDHMLGVAVTELKKNYSYTVQIAGLNRVSGERERRFITVVSDNSLSINQVFETALALPSDRPGSQVLSNQSLSLHKANRLAD